jgi:hypothetical protein
MRSTTCFVCVCVCVCVCVSVLVYIYFKSCVYLHRETRSWLIIFFVCVCVCVCVCVIYKICVYIWTYLVPLHRHIKLRLLHTHDPPTRVGEFPHQDIHTVLGTEGDGLYIYICVCVCVSKH